MRCNMLQGSRQAACGRGVAALVSRREARSGLGRPPTTHKCTSAWPTTINSFQSQDLGIRAIRPVRSALGGQGTQRETRASKDIPGFDLVKIPGNGSCMFQAIAQCQHYLSKGSLLPSRGLHEKGFELRRSICYMLDRNREDIQDFIGGDFDAYLHHMASEGVWGGEPELAMAAKVVERPILVYQTSSLSILSRQLAKTSEYGVDEFQNVAPICVLFDSYHYDSLLAK